MATATRTPRLSTAMREDERVSPLELFFDLVYVLALTQCTALMAEHPTWLCLQQRAGRSGQFQQRLRLRRA